MFCLIDSLIVATRVFFSNVDCLVFQALSFANKKPFFSMLGDCLSFTRLSRAQEHAFG